MSIKFNVFQWLEKIDLKKMQSKFVLMYYTYSSVGNSPSFIMSGIVRKSMFSLGKLRLASVDKSELG
jgi:hypothetical protein